MTTGDARTEPRRRCQTGRLVTAVALVVALVGLDGVDRSGATGHRGSAQPADHTVTLRVEVTGAPPVPGSVPVPRIEVLVACPPLADPADIVVIEFDSSTGDPIVPGSEVVALTSESCRITQHWFRTGYWTFTMSCGAVPATWSCEPGPAVDEIAVPDVLVTKGSEPGNLVVVSSNTFTDPPAAAPIAGPVPWSPSFTG